MTTISSQLLLLAVTVLCVAVIRASAENEIYENRGIKSVNGGEEQIKATGDKRPFFVGSRYGRSQSDISNMDSKPSMGRMVQRNDRFFFGSRYGKRSAAATPISGVDEDNNQPITCFYTGITNLFRCVENADEQEK